MYLPRSWNCQFVNVLGFRWYNPLLNVLRYPLTIVPCAEKTVFVDCNRSISSCINVLICLSEQPFWFDLWGLKLHCNLQRSRTAVTRPSLRDDFNWCFRDDVSHLRDHSKWNHILFSLFVSLSVSRGDTNESLLRRLSVCLSVRLSVCLSVTLFPSHFFMLL